MEFINTCPNIDIWIQNSVPKILGKKCTFIISGPIFPGLSPSKKNGHMSQLSSFALLSHLTSDKLVLPRLQEAL